MAKDKKKKFKDLEKKLGFELAVVVSFPNLEDLPFEPNLEQWLKIYGVLLNEQMDEQIEKIVHALSFNQTLKYYTATPNKNLKEIFLIRMGAENMPLSSWLAALRKAHADKKIKSDDKLCKMIFNKITKASPSVKNWLEASRNFKYNYGFRTRSVDEMNKTILPFEDWFELFNEFFSLGDNIKYALLEKMMETAENQEHWFKIESLAQWSYDIQQKILTGKVDTAITYKHWAKILKCNFYKHPYKKKIHKKAKTINLPLETWVEICEKATEQVIKNVALEKCFEILTKQEKTKEVAFEKWYEIALLLNHYDHSSKAFKQHFVMVTNKLQEKKKTFEQRMATHGWSSSHDKGTLNGIEATITSFKQIITMCKKDYPDTEMDKILPGILTRTNIQLKLEQWVAIYLAVPSITKWKESRVRQLAIKKIDGINSPLIEWKKVYDKASTYIHDASLKNLAIHKMQEIYHEK
ncbi:hypothetical protein KAU09_00170 [Candidatus Parcubacteria bacterium]|nr:hypothetical protein [Candidatus Parcubacteria bacterium]